MPEEPNTAAIRADINAGALEFGLARDWYLMVEDLCDALDEARLEIEDRNESEGATVGPLFRQKELTAEGEARVAAGGDCEYTSCPADHWHGGCGQIWKWTVNCSGIECFATWEVEAS